jgi:hypothetical protein
LIVASGGRKVDHALLFSQRHKTRREFIQVVRECDQEMTKLLLHLYVYNVCALGSGVFLSRYSSPENEKFDMITTQVDIK